MFTYSGIKLSCFDNPTFDDISMFCISPNP